MASSKMEKNTVSTKSIMVSTNRNTFVTLIL